MLVVYEKGQGLHTGMATLRNVRNVEHPLNQAGAWSLHFEVIAMGTNDDCMHLTHGRHVLNIYRPAAASQLEW